MPITLDGTLGVGTPGITLAGGAITANANQLNSSAEDVNAENRIINGDMNIWQRATSSSASGFVAADRWSNTLFGGTVTQSRQAFTLGDALGTTESTYFLRQTVSGQTLASQLALTQQKIEGVRSYAGQTITVLGWAKRFSGSGNMGVEVTQNFGTGGSPSAAISTSGVVVPLTTSWEPFAVVMNVASIAGKTLGSNNNDTLVLGFWASSGADNAARAGVGLQTIAVDLWGIHIRVGTWTAADTALYRPRDLGTELALCQRYYQSSSATAGINGSYINGYSFPVQMRIAPVIAVISGALAGSTWQADLYRFVQVNNSTGASGVFFGFDSEL